MPSSAARPDPAQPGAGDHRLQATTVARHLSRIARFGAPSGWYGTPSAWDGWWPPPAVEVVAAGRRDSLPEDLRSRYDVLLADGASAGVAPGLLERAFAGGARLDALAFLVRTWPELTDTDRAQVAAPLQPTGPAREVRLADALGAQTSPTTCGSAVLALLAAAGDPLLALWLVTGRAADGAWPREVAALPAAERSALSGGGSAPDAGDRFAAVQRAVKGLSNRSALGPLPWPAGLGTPPWGARRAARFPGATFRSVLIDDTDTATFRSLLSRVERSLAAGVGVPLFTGGDLGGGLAAAFPRHVVLLVPGADHERAGRRPDAGQPAVEAGRYTVYEPSSGTVQDLTRAELLAPDGPRAALGGWSHACWAILPGN